MAIEGTYEAKVKAPTGTIEMSFTLAVEGDELTGTVKSKKEEGPFRNGVVDGDEFSFDFDMKAPLGKANATLKGKVEGDDVNGFLTTPLGTIGYSGQRV